MYMRACLRPGEWIGTTSMLVNFVQPFILFLFLLSCLVHSLVLGCQCLFQPFWLLIKPPSTWDWPQSCARWDGSGMVEASQELVLATGSSLGREPEPWYPGDWSSIKEKIVLQVLRVSSENETLKTMFPKSAHHGAGKFIHGEQPNLLSATGLVLGWHPLTFCWEVPPITSKLHLLQVLENKPFPGLPLI